MLWMGREPNIRYLMFIYLRQLHSSSLSESFGRERKDLELIAENCADGSFLPTFANTVYMAFRPPWRQEEMRT